MNYGRSFVTLYRRQGARRSPRKRNAKWLSEEALQIAVTNREVKGKIYPFECRVPKIARRDKIVISAKKMRKTID